VGVVQDTVGFLERLLAAAEAGGRAGSVIEILVLLALAHQVRGDVPAALVPLERALALAEPEGYVRKFVDEGSFMVALLESGGRACNRRELRPAFAGRLRQHRGRDALARDRVQGADRCR
jgi:LuxR family maltose regulon positive regulatory protein